MHGTRGRAATVMLARIGVDVVIAYAVFIVIALFVSLLSAAGAKDFPITLADLLSGHAGFATLGDSSIRGVILVLVAAASMAVPVLWRHKLAPLAFMVPLFLTLYGFSPLYRQHRARQEAIDALGEFGQIMEQVPEQISGSLGGPFDSLGMGAYLLFAVAVYLAIKGVMRAFGR